MHTIKIQMKSIPELLLNDYDNVTTFIQTRLTVNIGGLDILMLPWINVENK